MLFQGLLQRFVLDQNLVLPMVLYGQYVSRDVWHSQRYSNLLKAA